MNLLSVVLACSLGRVGQAVGCVGGITERRARARDLRGERRRRDT
jgi:hypothetical protein